MILDDWKSHLAWMREESRRTGKPLAFDGYAGLGGWDAGLDAEGFLVLGCEIDPRIAALNPYPMIVADFTTLDPLDFRGFDLIVGSPPCRDFTQIGVWFGKRWKHPPDKENGLRLIGAFLKFVVVAKPRFWLMENVPLAVPHVRGKFGISPITIARLGPTMKRAFWGNAPAFLVPLDATKPRVYSSWRLGKRTNDGCLTSWEAARIPLPVARALGSAVRQALEASL